MGFLCVLARLSGLLVAPYQTGLTWQSAGFTEEPGDDQMATIRTRQTLLPREKSAASYTTTMESGGGGFCLTARTYRFRRWDPYHLLPKRPTSNVQPK